MDAAQAGEVLQDRSAGHAGGPEVARRVDQLEVVEHQVRVLRHGLQVRPGPEPAGVEGRGGAFGPQGRQGRGHEGGLHQRLAAGEGHAAPALLEEGPVPEHLGHQFRHGHIASHPLERAGGAGLGLVSPGRHRIAGSAAEALGLALQGLGFGGLAFGVVAPGAGQGAALQEHGGPQPRTILEAVALEAEDAAPPAFRRRHAPPPPPPQCGAWACRAAARPRGSSGSPPRCGCRRSLGRHPASRSR
ncbi:MAG: hypothetical protein BWY56_02398 [Acidobacteria bacterium ADurb.Bin340]|nr:MAG: hypothetical protein BWY56_02398 [Acidobacteria bacterium ADurb.Bin340]